MLTCRQTLIGSSFTGYRIGEFRHIIILETSDMMFSLVIKVRNNIISRLTSPLCRFLAKHGLARMTALLLRLHIKCLQREGNKNHSGCIHALILPKAGFTEDAWTIMGGDPFFRINALDRKMVKAVFLAYLPPKIDDNHYLTDDPYIEGKKKELRAFWLYVLEHLKKIVRIDVILTGNYSYAAEQELTAACRREEIPFIAIHKECLKTPALEDFFKKKYETRKPPFQGLRICVYNELEKGIQERAGVTQAERIIVTGMPRLDRIHSLRREMTKRDKRLQNTRPCVLFFSFNEKTGLPSIGIKTESQLEKLGDKYDRLSWKRLTEDAHLAMVKLAQQEPGLDVVVKTKGDGNAKRVMEKYYGKKMRLPRNMKIIAGGDPLKLIEDCDVVCGFNSTALIEAVAMGKPIVVPRFAEAQSDELAPYVVDIGDTVFYAGSQDELIDILRVSCIDSDKEESTQLDAKTKQILKRWTGNTDGKAGQRVRAVIEQVVKERRNRL